MNKFWTAKTLSQYINKLNLDKQIRISALIQPQIKIPFKTTLKAFTIAQMVIHINQLMNIQRMMFTMM